MADPVIEELLAAREHHRARRTPFRTACATPSWRAASG